MQVELVKVNLLLNQFVLLHAHDLLQLVPFDLAFCLVLVFRAVYKLLKALFKLLTPLEDSAEVMDVLEDLISKATVKLDR